MNRSGNETAGLCSRCTHHAHIRSDRGVLFHRCGLSDTDPRYPKYPRIPVLHCEGFREHVSTMNEHDEPLH